MISKAKVKHICLHHRGDKWYVMGVDQYSLPVGKKIYADANKAANYANQLSDYYQVEIIN